MREAVTRGLQYRHKAEQTYAEIMERSMDIRDLFMVPSLVSLSGLALVMHGAARMDTLRGVNEVAAGRGFDLLDGFLARALEQESELGSCVDAIADKAAIGVMTVAAWKHDAVPRPVLLATAASNLTNAAMTTAASMRHPEASFRPTATGKHAMALFNASIISHAYASALEREHPDTALHGPLRTLGNLAFYSASMHAGIAARQYAKRI